MAGLVVRLSQARAAGIALTPRRWKGERAPHAGSLLTCLLLSPGSQSRGETGFGIPLEIKPREEEKRSKREAADAGQG